MNSLLATQSTATLQKKTFMIILIGPPGAGKGTIANQLSEYLHFPHISTGDLLRNHIRNKTLLGLNAKKFIDKGHLVSDDLIINILFDRLDQPDCQNGVLLDGFPRTVSQAALLERQKNDCHLVALYFSIPNEMLIQRIVGRITCKDCGRPYHLHFDPPKAKGICDHCNGCLIQRDDDKEDLVRKRLEVYYEETHPVIEYFSKKNPLWQIESSNNKESIFKEVLRAIDSSYNS